MMLSASSNVPSAEAYFKVFQQGNSVTKNLSLFSQSCIFQFVPTGVVINGILGILRLILEIERFLKSWQQQAHSIEADQVLSRSISDNMIVQESLVTVNHEEQIQWLLPNVKPTKKMIQFQMVLLIDIGDHYDFGRPGKSRF